MASINVSAYVDFYIEREYSQYMEGYEVDDLEDYRETLTKNVRNLLKEFKNPQREFDIENNSIFQYFPLEQLSLEQQYTFLDSLMELKNEDGAIGNKVIHNLKKITYDLSDDRFDQLLLTDPIITPLNNDESYYKQAHRNIVRREYLKVKILLENNVNMHKFVLYNKHYDSVASLLNIYIDTMLQTINYWIISNTDLTSSRKTETLLEINKLLDAVLLDAKKRNQIPLQSKTLDTTLPIFVAILKLRNRCGEHQKVSNILLKEQCGEPEYFDNIPEEFYVTKEDLVSNQNIKLILNEGTNRCDHFDEKLEQTKAIIELLANANGRNVSTNNLLDLKVYFRELFISKSKYKTTALNIAKKYIASSKEAITLSEERFLNEKISRGYFREQSPIEQYNYKNSLQQKIYHCMLEILLSYDLTTITYISCTMTNLVIETAFSGININLPTIGIDPIFKY